MATKRFSWLFLVFLTSLLLFTTHYLSPSTYAATRTTGRVQTYIDKKLNFSVQIPVGWVAKPHPGQAKNANTTVVFTNTKLNKTRISIAVMRSSTSASSFASHGTPTLLIGSYPAFNLDILEQIQTGIGCAVRLMLAHEDIVVGRWCAKDALTHSQDLENILATYQDQATIVKNTIPMRIDAVNAVESCSQVVSDGLYTDKFPTNYLSDATFGAERVYPNDSAWTTSFGSGVGVCDDYSAYLGRMWEPGYRFQCVELASRFINEEWGLQEFDVNAANYYDYYAGGGYNDGRARTLFGNQVQLSDDASQGTSAFAPSAGDLLIFQDVNNVSQGWTSGLIPNIPGHVVVITSVASDHISVVQQNWHNGEIHSFPLSKVGNGYHITDNSGMPGRITRGWIHFSANQHVGSSTGGTTNTNVNKPSSVVVKYNDGSQDVIAVGTDGHMWHKWANAAGSWIDWNWFGTNTDFAAATPTLVKYNDGSFDLIAVGKDGRMWHRWASAAGSWLDWNWWSNTTSFAQTGPTVVKYKDGSQDVIMVGTDGHMWHKWANAAGGWIDWNWFGANTDFAVATPTLVTYNDGSFDLIAVGKDGRMWHKWANTAGSWLDWNWWSNTTSFAAATPALVKYKDGSFDLIAVGTDGHMWHKWASASGSWIDWNWWSTNTPFAVAGPLVIKYSDGSQDVIAIGKDGRMWHKWASAAGSWIDWNWWSNITNFTSSTPCLIRYADNSFDVVAVGTDGRMWHKWASAAGSWIDWNWWSNITPFVG